MATIYNATTITVTGASTELLPARPRRRSLTIGSVSTNPTLYLAWNTTAVDGAGIMVIPGSLGSTEVNEQRNEALYGISSGANSAIAVFEIYDDEV